MEGQIRRSVVWGVVGALVGALLGYYYSSNRVGAGASSRLVSPDSDELFILVFALMGAAVVGFGVFILVHFLVDHWLLPRRLRRGRETAKGGGKGE